MEDRLAPYRSIPEAFFALANEDPERTLYVQPEIDPQADQLQFPRKRIARNARSVKERVRRITHYLRTLDIHRGERVAILSGTRPEWLEADLAIMAAGAVSVAIYPSLTAEEVGFILHDAGAEIVFAENQEQLDKLLQLLSFPFAVPPVEDSGAEEVRVALKKIITLEEVKRHFLVTTLNEILAQDQTLTLDTFVGVGRSDVACLVYTSGTTGPPKGVMQTHGNHLTNIRQAFSAGMFEYEKHVALFLPLSHSLGRLIGYLGFLTPACLEFSAITSHTSSKLQVDSVVRDLREGAAQIVPLVPRILEKMQEHLLKQACRSSPSGLILKAALWAAWEIYRAHRAKRTPPIDALALYWLTGGVRRRLKRTLFGKSFEVAISGGARLQPSVAEFFDSLGIDVLEGYGLTETCVATNVNRRGARKVGTVGPVLSPDIGIKIGGDGEILFRGPNVALGYFNRPIATREAWDQDGWFHTGDIGTIDGDGYLIITGRKKELIVTAGGKKISPEKIETKLQACSLLSQTMVVGEGKPYCAALVVVNRKALASKLEDVQGLPRQAVSELDGLARELVWQEVERVNQSLPSFETIKKIFIVPEEFSIENGLLTPTLKLRRAEVLKRYSAEIEQLFG